MPLGRCENRIHLRGIYSARVSRPGAQMVSWRQTKALGWLLMEAVLLHLSAFPQGCPGYRSQQYQGCLCCGSLYSVVWWLKQSISISPKGAAGPGSTFLKEELRAGGHSIHLAVRGAVFMFWLNHLGCGFGKAFVPQFLRLEIQGTNFRVVKRTEWDDIMRKCLVNLKTLYKYKALLLSVLGEWIVGS